MLLLAIAVAAGSVRPGLGHSHGHCTDPDPLHPHGAHVHGHHHHDHDHEHRHGDLVHAHPHVHQPGESHDGTESDHDHCILESCPDAPSATWTAPYRVVIAAPPLATASPVTIPAVCDWRTATRGKPPPGGRLDSGDPLPITTVVLRL